MSKELASTYKKGDETKCLKDNPNVDTDTTPYCKDAYADNV